jgi:hypothetical protein
MEYVRGRPLETQQLENLIVPLHQLIAESSRIIGVRGPVILGRRWVNYLHQRRIRLLWFRW